MAKLHHLTLKSAVAKYQPLISEGKTETEILAAIAQDEKAFDEEGVNEIWEAIIAARLEEIKSKGIGEGDKEALQDSGAGGSSGDGNTLQSTNPANDGEPGANDPKETPPQQQSNGEVIKHIVIAPFADRNDFSKKFNPGDDVSHFDAARLLNLVKNNLVEVR